jgi:hypothetical protein
VKGTCLKIFYNITVVKNHRPANFSENDSSLFVNDIQISLPQSGLYLLKNVFVTDLGIIYKNLKAVKENIVCYDADFKKYRFRYFLKSFFAFNKYKYNGKKCIIIFDNYSGPNGFAHWICDGLTRLAEINDALGDYTIIAPTYFKSQKIYSESLNLFNVSKVHFLPEKSLTFFNELHFPTAIGDTGNFHPENVKKLKTIVERKINLNQLTDRNIYISRQKATRRFVRNEIEVVTLLVRYNFEIIYLENHSFEEQIQLINSARNIVSIHGAALAMLMFANENKSVLELRSKTDSVNNMYFLLANVCRLNYYYLLCESIENSKTANDFDLLVDIDDLEKNIQLMLSNKIDS